MGFEEATTSIHGGTDEAHKRLDLFLSQPNKVATFSKPKTAPTSLEPSTTMLSPYMKFGCIGVREIWWGCKEIIKNWKGKGETKEPENMFGQVSLFFPGVGGADEKLEFRDMYAAAEYGTPHFQRIRGNHACR